MYVIFITLRALYCCDDFQQVEITTFSECGAESRNQKGEETWGRECREKQLKEAEKEGKNEEK